MLTWNLGQKNEVAQVGRYTVKRVRQLGVDLYGIYLGEKLMLTKNNYNHATTYAWKLMARDERNNTDILELIGSIERQRQRMENV